MAIATLSQLRTAYDSAQRISAIKFGSMGPLVNRYYGMAWDYFGDVGNPGAGINPTTLNGTTYDKTSTGAIPLSTTGGSLYALADVKTSAFWIPVRQTGPFLYPGGSEFVVHVWDRIWANVINNATTARQAITFPALSRYTNGVGLSVWFRVLSAASFANTNFTLEYVNQDGVSKSITSTQSFTTYLVWHKPSIVALPLAAGDYGVRSVTAVTFGTAGGSANLVGLCLMKYLGAYRVNSPSFADSTNPRSLFSGLPQFDGNACLTLGVQVGAPPDYTGTYLIGSTTTMPQIGFEAKVLEL
jgi:hypothetical protein